MLIHIVCTEDYGPPIAVFSNFDNAVRYANDHRMEDPDIIIVSWVVDTTTYSVTTGKTIWKSGPR